MGRNIGFAAAYYTVIRASEAAFVVLLNNDTRVDPSWLAELMSAAERHGGGKKKTELDTEVPDERHGEEEVIRVHDALADLAKADERLARVVEMRYFGGLTEDEVAEAMGVSARTVRRDWEKARLMLAVALK